MSIASIAEFHLYHMTVVKMLVRGDMDEETGDMDSWAIIFLHQKRHLHLSRKGKSLGFILCVINGCLGVFAEYRVQVFTTEKRIPVNRIIHLYHAEMVNAITGAISSGIVDGSTSMIAAFSDFISLIQFTGKSDIFVNSITETDAVTLLFLLLLVLILRIDHCSLLYEYGCCYTMNFK